MKTFAIGYYCGDVFYEPITAPKNGALLTRDPKNIKTYASKNAAKRARKAFSRANGILLKALSIVTL